MNYSNYTATSENVSEAHPSLGRMRRLNRCYSSSSPGTSSTGPTKRLGLSESRSKPKGSDRNENPSNVIALFRAYCAPGSMQQDDAGIDMTQ